MNMAKNKALRVGIDARFYGPLGKGLGRYTQEVIDNVLALDKINEYVIFLNHENYEELKINNPKVTKVLADVRWYTLKEQLVMPRLIKQARLDLIHFPHFNVPFFCATPFVVTIHDLILTKFPTMRASTLGPLLYFIKNIFYRLIIKRAVRRAKKIIAVSNYTKQDIINQFSVEPNKVLVTLEGVATLSGKADTIFTKNLSTKKTLTNYCILEPYLLYIGNAYPHKNLESLVRVFINLRRQIPAMKLVLVGKSDYFYDRLKDYVKALRAKGIIFPGYVPDRDLDILFKRALAYVFPSKYEGFGLPPLEAMARGCPVVSSQATCLPEILGQAALYFDPANEADMYASLLTIIKNDKLRQELVSRGYEQVKKYNWQICAQQTKKIYEQVAQ